MIKKQFAVTVAVGAVMFFAGFGLRGVWNFGRPAEETEKGTAAGEDLNQGGHSSEEGLAENMTEKPKEDGQYLSPDMIQVRVDAGQVQWHDGTLWHTVCSVEELIEKDRFTVAQDSFLAYVEEVRRQEEALLQAKQEEGQTRSQSISVGQKETPKTTVVRPQTQTQVPEEVAPTPTPEPVAEPEENWGGGSNDTQAPAPPAVEEPAPPADTGDGENMEWSNDYL